MPEHMLDGPMNISAAHRLIGHCKHLDDRSLDHAIAEPTCGRQCCRATTSLNRLVRQRIKYCCQRHRRV